VDNQAISWVEQGSKAKKDKKIKKGKEIPKN
jgi:hypothetical protein